MEQQSRDDLNHTQTPESRDYSELQYAAMEALLELSGEAVEPVLAELEQRLGEQTHAAQEEFEQATQALEERFQERSAEARKQYEDHVQHIEQRFQAELSTAQANIETARHHVDAELHTVELDATTERDNEILMADTIVRSTIRGLRQEFKQAERSIAAARERPRQLAEQADELARAYDLRPSEPPVDTPSASAPAQPAARFNHECALAEQLLRDLRRLRAPRLLAGWRLWAISTVLCAAAAGAMGLLHYQNLPYWPPFYVTGPLAILLTLPLALIGAKKLHREGRLKAQSLYEQLQRALVSSVTALELQSQQATQKFKTAEAEAVEHRNLEVQCAKDAFYTTINTARQRLAGSLDKIEGTSHKLQDEIQERRDQGLHQIDAALQHEDPLRQSQFDEETARARGQYEQRMNACRGEYESALSAVQRRWTQGLDDIRALLDRAQQPAARDFFDWHTEPISAWSAPQRFRADCRFGQWHLDLTQVAQRVIAQDPALAGTGRAQVPAMLAFPKQGSLLLQSDAQGRGEAVQILKAVMVRLLTSLPPGRVHFTIIDPIGLGENFAGFMHLTDYEEALVGGRIWTEVADIEQRLIEFTNHMENVIQKYLRNEYATIDAYNRQAGMLAEPYRFLVVANFPVNFSVDAARRLSSIVSSGPRCGVYTLIAHDTRHKPPPGFHIEDLVAGCVHLAYQDERFVWQDAVRRRFELTLDTPPTEEVLTSTMRAVGQAARHTLRVEVPFENITPATEEHWTLSSRDDLRVPIGFTGATRKQHLHLGRGMAQHSLIAGKTGSGKSTLFHVVITNLALWYEPAEVELYLVDFKKGVEFKPYATHELPHVRVIAIESDREFGISVLQRLDAELSRRGDLFRHAGVQDISAYRKKTAEPLPRTLLLVDEFQVLFAEDDKLAQDASVLLDRLVRQGRAFGIHILLGSQTLGGTSRLARSTMGQMAVRIALQCSETDSLLILDDSNNAAKLLSRPGEAIYNDAGGLVEGNNPFQTAWLSEERREEYLRRVDRLAVERSVQRQAPIVFEGNTPADITKNRPLGDLLSAPSWTATPQAPRIWFGEPVAIKEPTHAALRRQSGANVLVVGQRDESAMAIMAVAMVSLAAQHHPQRARFVVLDGGPADSPHAGLLQQVAASLPQATHLVQWQEVEQVILNLAEELQRRQETAGSDQDHVYLLIHGLQRFRMLRRSDDDFSFSLDSADRPPAPGKKLAELLRDGPPLGIHVLTWADTLSSVERALDRQTIAEFDHRVLFQMSAADSSNLIDAPTANKLGMYRALLYSEEQGVIEKFRPYAAPDRAWLQAVQDRLNAGQAAVRSDPQDSGGHPPNTPR